MSSNRYSHATKIKYLILNHTLVYFAWHRWPVNTRYPALIFNLRPLMLSPINNITSTRLSFVEDKPWMGNYIPSKSTNMDTYPFPNLRCYVSKRCTKLQPSKRCLLFWLPVEKRGTCLPFKCKLWMFHTDSIDSILGVHINILNSIKYFISCPNDYSYFIIFGCC